MKNKMKRLLKNKICISFIISSIIYASLCFQNVIKPYDLLSFFTYIIIYIVIYKSKFEYHKSTFILSLIFSLLLIIGKNAYDFRYSSTISIFSKIFTLKNIIFLLSNLSYTYLIIMYIERYVFNNKLESQKNINNNKFKFLKYFLIIFMCYLPYLIIYYPGLLTSDSIDELNRILNGLEITDHHTIFHSIFMMIPCKIGSFITSNTNFYVALISLFQIIVVSLIFGYSVYFLDNRKTNRKILIIVLIYYALLPINGIYSVTHWKDIIFSASMVLLTIECIKLLEKKNNITLKNSYMFIPISLLVVFTRNNAIYMYVILSVFTIITFRKKLKVIIPMIAIVFGSYLIIKGPIYKMFDIKKSASSEYIAIPLQQIGRMAYKDVKFSEKEKKLIEKIIPLETLKKSYNPHTVDSIKFNEEYNRDEFEKNKGKYLKLWLDLCIKNPKIAVESYLVSTIGFWYPNATSVGPISASEIFENDLGIKNTTPEKIRTITSKLTSQNVPILGFFYSTGFCIWIIILCIYLTWKKFGKRRVYIYIPVIGIWLTMLVATPVAFEFRYVYSFYLCLPIFICLLFEKETKNKTIDK